MNASKCGRRIHILQYNMYCRCTANIAIGAEECSSNRQRHATETRHVRRHGSSKFSRLGVRTARPATGGRRGAVVGEEGQRRLEDCAPAPSICGVRGQVQGKQVCRCSTHTCALCAWRRQGLWRRACLGTRTRTTRPSQGTRRRTRTATSPMFTVNVALTLARLFDVRGARPAGSSVCTT